MNSLERVLAAISHKEPDRVPLFLLFSHYGAKEMKMEIRDYLKSEEAVVEAQLKMLKKYNNDCLYSFSYAPIEVEAYGGDVIFYNDGPPNAGAPIIKNMQDIETLKVPKIRDCEGLSRVLKVTEKLKKEVGNEVPIIGVVMSPFSTPVMQMGFDKYIELMYFNKEEFDILMNKNIEFCINWANEQLKAGATAICYFDPLASPNITEYKKYLETGFEVAKKTISNINGPVATHLASGIACPVIDEIVETGSAVVGFSVNDDLEDIKKASKNRICLLGNLNGIDMVNWDREKVRKEIENLILRAGQGGGLIISDNHGEIPWQVEEKTLLEVVEAVNEFGKYPIKKVF